MYTMYETLARDRMRGHQREAEQRRIAHELAAARRWHRVELRARRVELRVRQAERLARSAGRRHALRAG